MDQFHHQLSAASKHVDRGSSNVTEMSFSVPTDVNERLDWGLATMQERMQHVRSQLTLDVANQDNTRMTIATFLMSSWFEWALGFMVLAQLVIAGLETDYNAMSEEVPAWCYMLHICFVSVYTVELVLRIFVWRCKFFANNGNIFDLTVVGVDIACLAGEAVWGDDIPSVAFLRCIRMLKLVRTARVLKQFRELYVIAYSLAGVLKSIFWESAVLFVVLTIASIVAVEVIHPINKELAAEGKYDDCDRCPRAFESVMQSNLTLFQCMVAGDNWGLVIIPVIERRPQTAVFFVSLTLLVVLGLMNLILSAIVDKAAEVRRIVEATSLLEKRAVIDESRLKLVSVCEELDDTKTGHFNFDELGKAVETPMIQDALRVMDLHSEDLAAIFGMMDADASGLVSYKELADAVQRIKTQDDHMLLVLIHRSMKYYHKQMMKAMESQGAALRTQPWGEVAAERSEQVAPATSESTARTCSHVCGKAHHAGMVHVDGLEPGAVFGSESPSNDRKVVRSADIGPYEQLRSKYPAAIAEAKQHAADPDLSRAQATQATGTDDGRGAFGQAKHRTILEGEYGQPNHSTMSANFRGFDRVMPSSFNL